jgi:hypothetical protein
MKKMKKRGKKQGFVKVLREKVEEKWLCLKFIIANYHKSFARKRKIPVAVLKRVSDYLVDILAQSKEQIMYVLSDMWKRACGLA